MINQSSSPDPGPDPYAAWAYKGPNGDGKLFSGPDALQSVKAALADGWHDSPAKAVAAAKQPAKPKAK